MSPLRSRSQLIPWGVAIAALALWALGVRGPLALLPAQASQDAAADETTVVAQDGTTSVDGVSVTQDGTTIVDEHGTTIVNPDGTRTIILNGCEPTPTPEAEAAPAAESTPTPQAPQAALAAAGSATFRLCGPDAQVASALEQFIAGRSFNASLRGTEGGCADLTIRVSGAAPSGGRQSSTLSVGTSAGRVSVQIVNENGATRVSIGSTP